MTIRVFDNHRFGIHLILMIAGFIFVFECTQAIAQPRESVRAGEIMQVRMEQDLSTRNARRGQTFQTSLLEPVRSTNGNILIPGEVSFTDGSTLFSSRKENAGRA